MGFESPPPKGIPRVPFGGVVLMARNPSKLYTHHVSNLRELELAISHTVRLARAAIHPLIHS